MVFLFPFLLIFPPFFVSLLILSDCFFPILFVFLKKSPLFVCFFLLLVSLPFLNKCNGVTGVD